MGKSRLTVSELFAGIDAEADELAERLELGDDESVWAWLSHHYPDTMTKVASSGQRQEFIDAVRDLYEVDRDVR